MTEAIEDYIAVIEGPVVNPELRASALTNAIYAALHTAEEALMDRVLSFSQNAIRQVDKKVIPLFMSNTLQLLASPETKREWLQLFEQFVEEPSDSLAELEFFRPIAAVLATGDRSHLDPIPPEQREFAEEVLTKFEPGEASESDSSNDNPKESV